MVFVLTPTSVKNAHEKASQSTPPCLFEELLSSSVNNAGMTWIGKVEFTFYLFLWRMVGLSRCFKNLKSWNYLHEFRDKTLRLKKMNIFFQFEFPHIKIFYILSHLFVVVRSAGRASLIVLVQLLMNVTLMVILVLSNVNKSSSSFHH